MATTAAKVGGVPRQVKFRDSTATGASCPPPRATVVLTLDAALAPGRISGERYGPKQAAMVDR
jgi:hypothetical protein